MRILVVEDDAVLSDGLKVGLALNGWTIDAVVSCDDARAALAANRFDAVVLDVMLPDGSGLGLLANMRRERDATPVLLLTALDETADKVRGLDTGADDYLGKPFDLDELSARLRALGRRQAGRAHPVLAAAGIAIDPATQAATTMSRWIGGPSWRSTRQPPAAGAAIRRSWWISVRLASTSFCRPAARDTSGSARCGRISRAGGSNSCRMRRSSSTPPMPCSARQAAIPP